MRAFLIRMLGGIVPPIRQEWEEASPFPTTTTPMTAGEFLRSQVDSCSSEPDGHPDVSDGMTYDPRGGLAP